MSPLMIRGPEVAGGVISISQERLCHAAVVGTISLYFSMLDGNSCTALVFFFFCFFLTSPGTTPLKIHWKSKTEVCWGGLLQQLLERFSGRARQKVARDTCTLPWKWISGCTRPCAVVTCKYLLTHTTQTHTHTPECQPALLSTHLTCFGCKASVFYASVTSISGVIASY